MALVHCRQWDKLPHELANVVLGKLVNSFDREWDQRAGLRAILTLRLVSKSWEEAARGYTGKAYTKPQTQTDLLDLIKLLPNMTELHIETREPQYIQPVSACTQLSSLSISRSARRCGEREGGHFLDMSLLPLGLVELKVSAYGVNPSSFQNLSSMALTSLELTSVRNSPPEICKLMECLPRVQV